MVQSFKALALAGVGAVLALSYDSYGAHLRDLQGIPKECKGLSGNPNEKDRFCEESATKTESRCACKEICQIWGDPHVESFFTGCSVITMDDGYYTVFEVPGQIEIRGWMERKYVRRLYISTGGKTLNVDRDIVFNSEDCVNSQSGYINSYVLESDDGEPVTLEFATHCEAPGNSGDFHLNTTVITHDGCYGHENGDDDDDDDDDDVGDSSASEAAMEAAQADCSPRDGNKDGCERKGCTYNMETAKCNAAGVGGTGPDGKLISETCFNVEKKDCLNLAKSYQCDYYKDRSGTTGDFCRDFECSLLNKKNCKRAEKNGACGTYTNTCPEVGATSAAGNGSQGSCSALNKKDCKKAAQNGECDQYGKQCVEVGESPVCSALSKKDCRSATAHCFLDGKKCLDNDGSGTSTSQYGQVPTSTRYWANAKGACHNPCNQESMKVGGVSTLDIDFRGSSECAIGGNKMFWEEEFGKGKCKIREDYSWSGTKLTCDSECSAYGDPYVTDFFTNMPTGRGCKVGNDCFNTPFGEDYQELYTVPGLFQGLMKLDDCAYIIEFIARYAVDTAGNYYEQRFSAAEYCGTEFDGLISAADRNVVTVPTKPAADISTSGMSQQQIDNLAISKAVFESRVDGFHLGEISDSSVGDLDAGGIKVILKCHNTRKKGNRESKAYFNVCVHRNEVEPVGGFTTSTVGSVDLLTLEADLGSRGHCAFGAPKKGGNYANRDAEQVAAVNSVQFPAELPDGSLKPPLPPPSL